MLVVVGTVAGSDAASALRSETGSAIAAGALVSRPADEKFWQGRLLLAETDEKRQQEGRRLIQEAADRENVIAQTFLGECHLEGSAGFSKNPRRAVNWFRLAAGSGHAPAKSHLGICLAVGLGVTQDRKAALRWLSEAIAEPDAFQPVQPPGWYVERLVERGLATRSVTDAAADQATELGEATLAMTHYHLGQTLAATGQPGEALKHLETAARFGPEQRSGVVEAARQAALAHALGRGTPRDFSKANVYLELSRTLRHEGSMAAVRRFWPVQEISTEDLGDIEATAEQHAHVQLQSDLQIVATSLAQENPAEAVRWCTLAAESGQGWAMLQLAEIFATAKAPEMRDPALAFAWWQRAAEQANLPQAWANVAVCLLRGRGTEADEPRARRLLESHRRDNFMCELALIGEMPAGDDLSFEAWRAVLQQAALKRQQPVARFYHALMVFNAAENAALRQQGKSDPSLRKVVLPNLKAAADARVPEALHVLGVFHHVGITGTVDLPKARELFALGMDAGSSACAMALGSMALHGRGMRVDLERAAECFERAIALDPTIADAHNDLGVVYARRLEREWGLASTPGRKAPDKAQLEAWQAAMVANYQRADELGSAYGAFNLAELKSAGGILPQDMPAALDHYETAAGRGHVLAHRVLGEMYAKGQGAPESPSEALCHYRLAALQGDLPSLRAVCDFYEKGRGVPVDYEQAKLWFLRLFAAGDLAGVLRFGDMLHRQERYAEEHRFWQELLDRQDLNLIPGYAWDRLSVLYAEGLGVPRDAKRAAQYAAKAIKLDNIDAFSRRARRLMAENRPDEARKYLDVEWQRPSPEFLFLRGEIELWATPKHPANPQGWKYLKESARLGSLEARLRLAQACATGESEVIPVERALEYAREATTAAMPGAAELISVLESKLESTLATPP